jgi:trimeric autotransporter adhesin
MSQITTPALTNPTSGPALVAYLNEIAAAINSGNSGAVRPTKLVSNGSWVKEEGDVRSLMFWDGTTDHTLFTIDVSTGSVKAPDANKFNGKSEAAFLLKTGNLSGLTDKAAALANLGIEFEGLAAIAVSKGLNMVAGCVSLSSMDSDPFWTERMQHTSWENEPLNTATRGSRRTMPSARVIIAEADKVHIFDGDDATLPMWRIFTAGNGADASWAGADWDITSVAMLNGILTIGQGSTYGGLRTYNFAADTQSFFRDTASEAYARASVPFLENISNASGSGVPYLVNEIVRSVVMTTLPGAPIDPATGMPEPTILVATVAGVSQIGWDGVSSGNVWDMTAASWTLDATAVAFTGDGKIAVVTASDRAVLVQDILTADFSVTGPDYLRGNTNERYIRNEGGAWTGDLIIPCGAINGFTANGYDLHLATTAGLATINRNPVTPTDSLFSVVTADYFTGTMTGGTVLALADTDQGDIVSPELVTNGDFATDITGWTANANASLAWVSNALQITNVNSGYGKATTPVNVVTGETYVLSVNKVSGNNGNVGLVSNADGSGSIVGAAVEGYSVSWTSDRTGTIYVNVQLQTSTVGNVLLLDDVSFRRALPDRAAAGNGVQVIGTLQRNPVATGAELVAYSGTSASNYLEQPYNADLDAGTAGDFFACIWAKRPHQGYSGLVHRTAAKIATSDPGFSLYFTPTDVIFKIGTGTEVSAPHSNLASMDLFCLVRENSVLRGYVNGVEVGSAPNTQDLTVASAVLTLAGYWQAGGLISSTATEYNLFRASKTALSAADIAKMYRDEKKMFLPDSQITLTGTSSDVRGLAHVPDERLDLIGTPSGMSTFAGFRRVDEDAEAVNTFISAAGDFIVKG